MISSTSVSDTRPRDAFDRLAPAVRSWIREQGWDGLRDIQTQATFAILDEDRDVLIAAATAAGKTEAAFLPVLTKVAGRAEPGLSVLYVSPLKALINDQHRRLDQLCERMEIPLVRWHGDAPASAKARMLKRPSGIALITPESIEALFIRKPAEARRLLGRLDAILIDELHAFLAGARGLHLASLLKRIDAIAGRRARRIGLSATIGDPEMAAAWLCPREPAQVLRLSSDATGMDLRLQIRGYLEPSRPAASDRRSSATDGELAPALAGITDHLFETLRGENNLVFGGSRQTVETVADQLRLKAERACAPNEFFPHHGNLSKELREELEVRLKDGSLPTTAVCTSTLELGIDIGSVRSVALIGAPRSLASLRQRLGRSGRRRGVPAILRVYVREAPVEKANSLRDVLRLDTVRSVAAIRLLGERFVEPPPASDPALATALLHQTLSIIAERGGARADTIFGLLGGSGPYASVTSADFVELLRGAAHERVGLIEQAPDGTLLLGERGEHLVQSREFYALFESEAEWRLLHGGRPLGTIPLGNVITVGGLVVFAGRRWSVEAVDERARVLQVAPHSGGTLPKFEGASVEPAHDRLVAEMRRVLKTDAAPPPYLDPHAAAFVTEGRDAYKRLGLNRMPLLDTGQDVHLMAWRGDIACGVLAAAFTSLGFQAEPNDVGVTLLKADSMSVRSGLARIARFETADLERLAAQVRDPRSAKLDAYVPEAILRRFWCRRHAAEVADVPRMAALLATHRVAGALPEASALIPDGYA
ncbi:DEAD/DEAH box helicase [Methylobacterium radiodurans]|uniref:DEAD/DEAH box helicase n=1 Tax=Methylobacterium radiodurans TaxID=2202828 RepID=A0A2U8VNG0_9HYPH|nr:DEAD/DEAH box helicase [Methylobacterium radiodurans]AWN35090.1 DEAD/DEAH box helicase [Methylobacterium radiodurans]